jgi:hypothetical protein
LPFDVFNMTELNVRRNSLAAKNVSESITNAKNSQEPLRDTFTPTYPLTPLPSITRTVIYIYYTNKYNPEELRTCRGREL